MTVSHDSVQISMIYNIPYENIAQNIPRAFKIYAKNIERWKTFSRYLVIDFHLNREGKVLGPVENVNGAHYCWSGKNL